MSSSSSMGASSGTSASYTVYCSLGLSFFIRRQAPQLQDASVTGHGGKLGGGHKLPAQPLGVLVVAFGLPSGAALGLHGDGGLAQPVLGNLLDGAGLPAPEEYHAVHVA